MLNVIATLPKLPDACVLAPFVHRDSRGHFFESFIKYELESLGLVQTDWVQDNESFSIHGVLRGLHFQKEHPQDKLVRVVKGRIWDVIVDVRLESPTFGQWDNYVLDDLKHDVLFVPKGFAHGFLTLSAGAHVVYKCSDFYYPADQHGILFSDHELNIPWQSKLLSKIIVSEQDQKWPTLSELRKELTKNHGKPSAGH
jgi:dTDP-4-dehydrorhamnose 3,5-epimerase